MAVLAVVVLGCMIGIASLIGLGIAIIVDWIGEQL